jgi:hypothetical protein
MGMKWRFVLAPCNETQAGAIGERCQPYLGHLQNPIKLSLLYYRSRSPTNTLSLLELVAFASREPEVASMPPAIERLIPATGNTAADAALKDLRSWSQFLVAYAASQVVGEAYFCIYSDTLNCSGMVHLTNGQLSEGYVYGLNGSDTHLRFEGGRASYSFGELREYVQPLTSGLATLFPCRQDVLEHIETEYEPRTPVIDFLLMEKRTLLTPPKRLERGAA